MKPIFCVVHSSPCEIFLLGSYRGVGIDTFMGSTAEKKQISLPSRTPIPPAKRPTADIDL